MAGQAVCLDEHALDRRARETRRQMVDYADAFLIRLGCAIGSGHGGFNLRRLNNDPIALTSFPVEQRVNPGIYVYRIVRQ